MWPFKRRTPPRVESVRLGDLSSDADEYPILTVGQSRLAASFAALALTSDGQPRVDFATLTPVVDPNLRRIADITITVEGHVVGYLRPPDLRRAAALLDEHHAAALEVPCRLFWSPAGPEVNLRLP